MSDSGHDGHDSFFAGPARTEIASAAQAGRTPGRRRRVVPTALVLMVISSAIVIQLRPSPGAASNAPVDGAITFAKARPPVQSFVNPTRLLPAPTPPAGSGGYTAMLTRNAAPVTWDPCQPIHFVVRPDGVIPSGRAMLDQVMYEISQATGLLFIDDGATTEAPGPSHNPYQPDRYGKKWAPVLIAWASAAQDPVLAGDVVGSGGPEATAIAGQGERIVSGMVVFDAPDLTAQLREPDGGALVEQVMRHELGHLVGLGHIDDPTQVMDPIETRGLGRYGDGDLRGLAAMGSGLCFTKG
jgi:hypothetical protein